MTSTSPPIRTTTQPVAKRSHSDSANFTMDRQGIALVPSEGFFEGQVAVLGETRLEGTVRGSLRGPGELIVGRGACVEGVIECEVVSSCGEIVGPIVVGDRARFTDGARFEGDLEAPIVEIEGDVIWNGKSRVGK